MSRRIYPFERSVPHRSPVEANVNGIPVLTIGELEDGVRALHEVGTNREDFWAANGTAFHETLKAAFRETSEALEFEPMSSGLRAELESQLVWLTNYLSSRPQTLN